jgi:3,4-dihydroxy 2-butanone 4-phosphate synthase/GTP cyclohydrolase II
MHSIESALTDLKLGKMIIVMDDEDRENEGDLIASSELCTPETINFMATHGKGLVCVAITSERAKELELDRMVKNASPLHGTNFTVSVDYVHGTTTGISAYDRSVTVKALADLRTKPEDLGRPGHIFPLIAVKEGILRRTGHTEATVDLNRLAGLYPSGVLCEIINEDGTMARRPDLEVFAEKHNLKIITIKDLVAYRMAKESLVKNVAKAKMPTKFGDFNIYVYENVIDGKEHCAMVCGKINPEEVIPVRVHSECLTGDVFGSKRCDCGEQLENALQMIARYGNGILLYMRQEGRGIGLINKIKAYALQEQGMDTVEANVHLGFAPDARDYGIGAQILADLGVRKMKLITNNPQKRVGLEGYGLTVTEMLPIEMIANEENLSYLLTKREKMGHLLSNLE